MKPIQHQEVVDAFPIRPQDTYKNKLGHVLCIGGNQQMGGAIILSGMAALYSGAGLVTVASHPVNCAALHSQAPEIMFADATNIEEIKQQMEKAIAIVLGPGLGQEKFADTLFDCVFSHLSQDHTLILDADGLNLWAKKGLPQPNCQLIITPHLGEWSRISGLTAKEENPTANQAFIQNHPCILVLKKSRTEIYFDHSLYQNTTGTPAMATGGMGDTLTGILASFIGQYNQLETAVTAGVYIHSYTAEHLARTQYVALPNRIIQALPQIMAEFRDEKIKG